METPDVERVVLVDEAGGYLGTAPKSTVHHDRTPLHLAFSCYVLDPEGRLLVTRRALAKRTWPGVWTNSVCGHPGPGEDLVEAVHRRAGQELGVRLEEVSLVLPAFRYQAVMDDGTRENELCPVFVAVTGDRVGADPEEVEEVRWEPWPRFRDEVLLGGRAVSPWCALQVAALAEREGPPGRFTPADDPLPPALVGGL